MLGVKVLDDRRFVLPFGHFVFFRLFVEFFPVDDRLIVRRFCRKRRRYRGRRTGAKPVEASPACPAGAEPVEASPAAAVCCLGTIARDVTLKEREGRNGKEWERKERKGKKENER